ncbi:MAG: LysR family transcriptional regulator [Pseudomonadota bacterium]
MDVIRKFDLNLLVVFEAIYSTGNITQAAKKLGLSQPTISNALTRLRNSFDDPLFLRKGHGVIPTSKANQLIGAVRRSLQTIRSEVSVEKEFDPATTKRNFRILILDQLEPILVPPIVKVIENYNSVTIDALPVSTTPIAEDLCNGNIDIALTTYISGLDELQCETIGRANVVVVARKGHPRLASGLTLENFCRIGQIALPLKLRVLSRVDEFLRQNKIERHVVYTVSKFWSFPHIISSTDLIAIMPGDFAAIASRYYPIEIFDLPFEMPEQQIYMSWTDNNTSDSGHIWLREQFLRAYHNSDLTAASTAI